MRNITIAFIIAVIATGTYGVNFLRDFAALNPLAGRASRAHAGGFYSGGNNSMLNDGKVLAEVDSIEFAPYAFLKWEWGKGKS